MHGEYNSTVEVRKEMIVSAEYWRKPQDIRIYLNEYQIYDVSPILGSEGQKRRLLCKTYFLFYEDQNEDQIQKVKVTITDDDGDVCFTKTYSQVDRLNRRFFTNQLSIY